MFYGLYCEPGRFTLPGAVRRNDGRVVPLGRVVAGTRQRLGSVWCFGSVLCPGRAWWRGSVLCPGKVWWRGKDVVGRAALAPPALSDQSPRFAGGTLDSWRSPRQPVHSKSKAADPRPTVLVVALLDRQSCIIRQSQNELQRRREKLVYLTTQATGVNGKFLLLSRQTSDGRYDWHSQYEAIDAHERSIARQSQGLQAAFRYDDRPIMGS